MLLDKLLAKNKVSTSFGSWSELFIKVAQGSVLGPLLLNIYINELVILLKWWLSVILRSSHRRCSLRKGVLRNFVKFTGKHLCQSFCEFWSISTKKTFFTELLLATASEFAHDMTFYGCGSDLKCLIETLEHDSMRFNAIDSKVMTLN